MSYFVGTPLLFFEIYDVWPHQSGVTCITSMNPNMLIYFLHMSIYLVEMLQVRIWSDTHSSIGRLACYARGTHWFHAYGMPFTISIYHSLCEFQMRFVLTHFTRINKRNVNNIPYNWLKLIEKHNFFVGFTFHLMSHSQFYTFNLFYFFLLFNKF